MRLWFDENLSPSLVHIAHDHGFEATCNRDRGALGLKDPQLRASVQAEGYVFVTDNAIDFRPMYERARIHPGLVIMPARSGRDRQQHLVRVLIEWIIATAAKADETPADFLVNTLVEIDDDGGCTSLPLPDPSGA